MNPSTRSFNLAIPEPNTLACVTSLNSKASCKPICWRMTSRCGRPVNPQSRLPSGALSPLNTSQACFFRRVLGCYGLCGLGLTVWDVLACWSCSGCSFGYLHPRNRPPKPSKTLSSNKVGSSIQHVRSRGRRYQARGIAFIGLEGLCFC